MNNDLKNLLSKTKQSMIKVKEYKEIVKQNEIIEKEERTTTQYNESSREVVMIKSLGLEIESYEPPDPKDGYYEAMEYYYCSNDIWKIKIRNILYDADLGTILQVLGLENKKTGEEVKFYCDLWCQNTNPSKLEKLKILLECANKQEYIDKEFGRYYSIPRLLEEQGFIVKEMGFTFDAERCNGHLEIRNKKSKSTCSLNIDHYYGVNIYLSNAKEDKYYSLEEKVQYPFTYESDLDIEVLVGNINAILEHIDGEFGFYEHNTYYNNKDIDILISHYEDKLTYLMDTTDSYSYGFGYNDEPTEEGITEYERMKDVATINHYKGAEIYKRYKIDLNHDAFHFGGIANEYDIEIIYNKNIDKDNCILNIARTESLYAGRNNLLKEGNADDNEIESTTDELSVRGGYLYIADTLIELLDGILEAEKELKQ